ncbi:MAG TPA: phage portal protein [Hungateiclostridium thermocellum]|uniref:XkdM protein, phage-like element PBSX n=1 Tax=Acetivibrio thermocellus (strain ATCC 27405 / DSM 1237 / JCM 9322 / NBRC 103400 / NCIMB 10682 / NRRL B-4536 / VPI 7372) TaxID=203119 RepID=A3DIA9_ACET2|nr:phage tail tube protein [Acetivibrio thermocellus]ABN53688.1 XkdM protein, phage-like element PBSX [Acetivibrio thermocellus ATCC 27405]HBW25708.1 phage portal protein [Acetivibrio thermocellus]
MADNYVRLSDTISSKEGKAYITINGQNRELFEISSLTAQLELQVQSRQMLGHRMVQHKVVGAEGTGSMTMYFMNSDMLRLAIQYIKEGKYGGLKLQIKNEDAQSTIGKQEIVLLGVLLNTIPVAALDDQSDDPITVDTDFTFDDIEGLSFFDLPANYR